jgi:hypothetical protein
MTGGAEVLLEAGNLPLLGLFISYTDVPTWKIPWAVHSSVVNYTMKS